MEIQSNGKILEKEKLPQGSIGPPIVIVYKWAMHFDKYCHLSSNSRVSKNVVVFAVSHKHFDLKCFSSENCVSWYLNILWEHIDSNIPNSKLGWGWNFWEGHNILGQLLPCYYLNFPCAAMFSGATQKHL